MPVLQVFAGKRVFPLPGQLDEDPQVEWRDQGIVLSVRPHGETSAILEVLTEAHGRHMGLVRGGASRRMKPVLQPGNSVMLAWRARLSEHLGTFTVDLSRARAGTLMDEPMALSGLLSACAVAGALPEREAHTPLYEAFEVLLDAMAGTDIWPAVLVRWELGLLQELGYGLDLSKCAATGSREDLVYVSPKSGRAVSRAAGQDYKDRLLMLPGFLMGAQAGSAEPRDVANGLRLTAHFMERYLFAPQDKHLPDARLRLQALFERRFGQNAPVQPLP